MPTEQYPNRAGFLSAIAPRPRPITIRVTSADHDVSKQRAITSRCSGPIQPTSNHRGSPKSDPVGVQQRSEALSVSPPRPEFSETTRKTPGLFQAPITESSISDFTYHSEIFSSQHHSYSQLYPRLVTVRVPSELSESKILFR